MKPIKVILAKHVAWHWDEPQQNAFSKLKLLLTQAPALKYYDVNKDLTLQVHASKSGLGATLFQDKHPIAMASKTLDKAQSYYTVFEKEMLAMFRMPQVS